MHISYVLNTAKTMILRRVIPVFVLMNVDQLHAIVLKIIFICFYMSTLFYAT